LVLLLEAKSSPPLFLPQHCSIAAVPVLALVLVVVLLASEGGRPIAGPQHRSSSSSRE